MEQIGIEEIIRRYEGQGPNVLGILQDIQQSLYYLPKEALEQVARRLGIPLIQLYSLATFYTSFSLRPRGRQLIQVCHGTACHVRGAVRLTEQLSRELAVQPGDTTPDRQFTLEVVRCVGCCSLAPVVRIDGATYGRMTPSKIVEIIQKR